MAEREAKIKSSLLQDFILNGPNIVCEFFMVHKIKKFVENDVT